MADVTRDNEHKGVWVYLEHHHGQLAPVARELLGEGRRLADKLGSPLAGALLGHGVGPLAGEAFAYGADEVYCIDAPVMDPYRNQAHAHGMIQLVRRYKPEVLLLGATTTGRDLASSVATELETGLTADCTELDVDPKDRKLLQTRPAFGGNILATILCRDRWPQMATVRPRVFSAPEPQPGRQGKLIMETTDLREDQVAMKVLRFIGEERREGYLDQADIIVAGGRGMGGRENFGLLEDLAQVIGGMVGASRAAVESGWAPPSHQVGQTGLTVRPKLYIACGISGAIQHLVGMQNAEIIVAINKDPQAPIFRVATYGIVGDAVEILPHLIRELGERMQGEKREAARGV